MGTYPETSSYRIPAQTEWCLQARPLTRRHKYSAVYILVITKGYVVRATTIEGKIAPAPALCFAQGSRDW